MALIIKGIPDARAYWGESMEVKLFAFAPGTSDYVTGGYVITAAALTFGHIFGATVLGVNAAGLGYIPQVIIAQTSAPLASLTSMKFAVLQSGAGSLSINGTAAKITLVGGQSAGVAVQITPDTSSAVLGKTTATNFNVAAPITGLTASGTAGTLSEVANGANLTGVVWTVSVLGY